MTPAPYQSCQTFRDVLKRQRSNFFSSFFFLPKPKRQALKKIYGFARIIDDCVDELDDVAEKEEALNFWQGHLQKIYRNAPDHPLMRELAPVIRRYSIPEKYFLGLIEGCRLDIKKTSYETFEELLRYCYRVASLIGLMCLKIFEYDSDTSEQMAIDLGYAFQLTNILRDVGQDLAVGRIYLPKNEMARFGYCPADLKNKVRNKNFFAMMDFFYKLTEGYYQKAFLEFKKDKANRLIAARIMARFYFAILKKIRKKNYPVFLERVSLSGFEKMGLICSGIFKK